MTSKENQMTTAAKKAAYVEAARLASAARDTYIAATKRHGVMSREAQAAGIAQNQADAAARHAYAALPKEPDLHGDRDGEG